MEKTDKLWCTFSESRNLCQSINKLLTTDGYKTYNSRSQLFNLRLLVTTPLHTTEHDEVQEEDIKNATKLENLKRAGKQTFL